MGCAVSRSVRWRPFANLCCLLGFLVSVPFAQAQEEGIATPSRAASLTAERDKKAGEIAAPQRGKVERALYWYDNQYLLAKVFGGWNGIHLAGGDFPAGAGMKFGVGFSRPIGAETHADQANHMRFDTVAAYSTRGYSRFAVSGGLQRIGGAPVDLRLLGQYYKFPQEDFFGLGSGTRKEDRTNYLHEAFEAGTELRWRPARMIDLGTGVSFISPTIGSGTDTRFPSTDEVFDSRTLPGYTEQPNFLRADASVAVDWRDNPLHPHGGGRYGVEFSDFRDQDLHAFGFRRVAIDLQQYVPVPNRYRTVALRAAAVFTDARAGQEVPFFLQPTLGGSQALRGFREFRFRDQNSLLLTAEYRWEASWLLDGAVFADAGTVASDRRDLTLRDLDVSYGVGFRVHSNRAFVARLDLAFSREGFIPLLRFEHVF